MPRPAFQRDFVAVLKRRPAEPRQAIQLLAGPRQVGKSTGVLQALAAPAPGRGARGLGVFLKRYPRAEPGVVDAAGLEEFLMHGLPGRAS